MSSAMISSPPGAFFKLNTWGQSNVIMPPQSQWALWPALQNLSPNGILSPLDIHLRNPYATSERAMRRKVIQVRDPTSNAIMWNYAKFSCVWIGPPWTGATDRWGPNSSDPKIIAMFDDMTTWLNDFIVGIINSNTQDAIVKRNIRKVTTRAIHMWIHTKGHEITGFTLRSGQYVVEGKGEKYTIDSHYTIYNKIRQVWS